MTLEQLHEQFLAGEWDNLINLADNKYFNAQAKNALIGKALQKEKSLSVQQLKRELAWQLTWREALSPWVHKLV